MDFTMNTKLDGLYYRTSATPSLCGPYKTVTTYNSCSADKGQSTKAYTRTDFTRDDAAKAKMISAADQSLYKQILQYPESLPDIIGSKDEGVQRNYVNNLIKKFPNLESVLKPLYPKLFETVSEGYKYDKYKNDKDKNDKDKNDKDKNDKDKNVINYKNDKNVNYNMIYNHLIADPTYYKNLDDEIKKALIKNLNMFQKNQLKNKGIIIEVNESYYQPSSCSSCRR